MEIKRGEILSALKAELIILKLVATKFLTITQSQAIKVVCWCLGDNSFAIF
jgi:hypothetical protein